MVINVAPNAPTFSEKIREFDSIEVTVPTGEVWVMKARTSNNNIVINGATSLDVSEQSKTVVTGGDTMGASFEEEGWISGYKVHNHVDNTATSLTESTGGTVSLPSGNPWHVTILSESARCFIGSEQIEVRCPVQLILDGGTTIEPYDASVHVGGFQLG